MNSQDESDRKYDEDVASRVGSMTIHSPTSVPQHTSLAPLAINSHETKTPSNPAIMSELFNNYVEEGSDDDVEEEKPLSSKYDHIEVKHEDSVEPSNKRTAAGNKAHNARTLGKDYVAYQDKKKEEKQAQASGQRNVHSVKDKLHEHKQQNKIGAKEDVSRKDLGNIVGRKTGPRREKEQKKPQPNFKQRSQARRAEQRDEDARIKEEKQERQRKMEEDMVARIAAREDAATTSVQQPQPQRQANTQPVVYHTSSVSSTSNQQGLTDEDFGL